MKKSKKAMKAITGAALAFGLIIPQAAPVITYAEVMDNDIVNLRILETTDIHTNIVNYDYFKDAPTQSFGLSKTATLIKQAREENANTLLFDNGDIIQGSPLGDYVATVDSLQEGEVHPAVKALNLLGYDAATVGNHEFNYGLEFLDEAMDDAEYPVLSGNVYKDDGDDDPTNDQTYFDAYEILDREVTDEDGEKHIIKVGVLGFVAPQIMNWDRAHLQGKVITKDIVNEAKSYIPKMKEEGADIVVVLSHSGIADLDSQDAVPEYQEFMENASYYLTQVDGIDAVLSGHQHKKFPAVAGTKADFPDGQGFDNTKGTINGVPVTMPSSWGDYLGVIDMTLEKNGEEWIVKDAGSTLRSAIGDTVPSDAAIEEAIKTEHEGTVEYVRSPVGETTSPINSYFALVQDDPSVQIVTNAQKWYVESKLKGTEYEGLPVLSAGAPFKAGGRNGAEYYTDIPAGTIAIKNVADLYLYPNTVYALKISGAELKNWLEWSAAQFNQVDTASSEVQPLINTDFPTYNFDIIDGITYEIDVTKPAKYAKDQSVINPESSRIANLKYDGKPVTEDMEFVVATNNYRASTNVIVNPEGKNTILAAPDENRQAIINYIQETKTINPSADGNWTFAPVAGEVKVSFESSPNAQKYLDSNPHIEFLQVLSSGFAEYTTTLPKKGGADFSDVPADHWAHKYISELAANHIVQGTDEGVFNPEGKITRAQFASLVVRTLGLTAENKVPFTDVSGRLASDIAAAYEAGIVSGTSKTTFSPNSLITREQMAAMIVRAYEVKTGKGYDANEKASYKDAKSISPRLAEYVHEAAELGIMNGSTTGKFLPKNNATRAQAAKVIYELYTK